MNANVQGGRGESVENVKTYCNRKKLEVFIPISIGFFTISGDCLETNFLI